MKFIIVLAMLVALALHLEFPTYSSKFDDIVSHNRFKDSSILKMFVTCFVGTRCKDEALLFYKGIMREAIQQGCAKCTDKQKILLNKLLLALKNDAPSEYFEVFRKKYDPENIYFEPLMVPMNESLPNATKSDVSKPITYSGVYDYVDFDMVVGIPDILKSWYNCFMRKCSCDRVQASFRAFLREAIQQSCARCTEKQKVILSKFATGLRDKAPEDYKNFKQEFDPESNFLP